MLTSLTAWRSETVNETPAPPTGEVTLPKVETPQRTALESLLYRLEEGESVEVAFDACPFDDEGWIAEGDHMGNVKCGETYTVSYDDSDNKWIAKGLEEYRTGIEGKDFIGTRHIAGIAPRKGELFLWGGRYVANEDGEILTVPLKDMPLTVVGHYNIN